MLFLNPPYFIIDGVSIFPDHADRLQFYYLPMMPRLSTSKDASGADMPVIQLIEYAGAAGTGGFINFDVKSTDLAHVALDDGASFVADDVVRPRFGEYEAYLRTIGQEQVMLSIRYTLARMKRRAR